MNIQNPKKAKSKHETFRRNLITQNQQQYQVSKQLRKIMKSSEQERQCFKNNFVEEFDISLPQIFRLSSNQTE
jgi:arginine deiminase